MKTLVLGEPPPVLASLILERQRLGLDTHDEIWDGDYHMSPAASGPHGRSEVQLGGFLDRIATKRGLFVGGAFNLGDAKSFRVPDLGVHREDPLDNWFPAAAIVVEIRSPDDESYEKFGFYFDHGVEEILIADLVTQATHWYVRGDVGFEPAGASAILNVSNSDVDAALGW